MRISNRTYPRRENLEPCGDSGIGCPLRPGERPVPSRLFRRNRAVFFQQIDGFLKW
jgi:hypothetical protein